MRRRAGARGWRATATLAATVGLGLTVAGEATAARPGGGSSFSGGSSFGGGSFDDDDDGARPFLSDRLWLSMRYWIRAYEQQGLQNLMERAKVDRMEVAAVARDPFFHAITVRVWATALDFTVHRETRAVVSGNPHTPREYSEYWTFIRSAERRGAASTDAQCPSCGSALAINMAGSCEHCGVKLTAGQFDWVLSKIEQDEAYRG